MRSLVLGDLHFGSGKSLAVSPGLLERLAPELEWADRLIINGDMLHSAPLGSSLPEARAFVEFALGFVEEISLVLGNHEFWMLRQNPTLDGVGAAQAVLDCVLPPLRAFYPSMALPEASLIHGHQIFALQEPEANLDPQAYDSTLGPWFELYWVLGRSGLQASRFLREEDRPRLAPPGELLSLQQAMLLMERVAVHHSLPPGRVLLGHLHQQFGPIRSGDFEFWSPGGWFLDDYVMSLDPDPLTAHPGGVLRVSPEGVESRRLLDDLSFAQLKAYCSG